MRSVALFIFFVCISTSAWAEQYVLGVVPQQSPVKLFKTWKPIVDYLSESSGHKVTLKTEKSISAFEKVLYRGDYDFAYMNPYHYIVAQRSQSYDAAVRANKMIRGILVAREEKLQSYLAQANIKFLFPSPNAFAATLLVKYELLTEFNIDINKLNNYQYVNSHDSVYKGIARDIGDLGGGIQRTFMNFNKGSDKKKLHVVFKTKPYPSHPIAFRANMSTEAKEKIIRAFLNMPDALKQSMSIKKMIRTSDKEYDSIRDLEKKLAVTQAK